MRCRVLQHAAPQHRLSPRKQDKRNAGLRCLREDASPVLIREQRFRRVVVADVVGARIAARAVQITAVGDARD